MTIHEIEHLHLNLVWLIYFHSLFVFQLSLSFCIVFNRE